MRTVLFYVIICISLTAQAQSPAPALGFLEIEPDARSSAMGGIGVATSPDNFVFYNPAKVAMRAGYEYGISAGYVPYLRRLVKGIGMATMHGFRRLDDQTCIGLDLRYFSLGAVSFKDETGYPIYEYNPTEWTIGLTYSRQLSEYNSIGITARYINSRPAAGIQYQGQEIKTANAAGVDFGYYYCSVAASELNGYTGGIFRGGLSFSNLGTKVVYYSAGGSAFQPMNFRAGVSYTFSSPGDHLFSLSGEVIKGLVPAPVIRDDNGDIISGKDPATTNVPAAFFSSWADMKGWGVGAGVEYLYRQQFFLRGGIHYENPDYSPKQLATVGAGFQLGAFHLDLSYYTAIVQKTGATNAQAQTFKISLGVILAAE